MTLVSSLPPHTLDPISGLVVICSVLPGSGRKGASVITYTDPARLLISVEGFTGLIPVAEDKVGLYTNVISPSHLTVIGDLTEPTFTGYAQQSLTLDTANAYLDPATNASFVDGGDLLFIATAVPTPEDIQGWFIVNDAGTELHAISPFASPVPIMNPGQGVHVDLVLSFPPVT